MTPTVAYAAAPIVRPAAEKAVQALDSVGPRPALVTVPAASLIKLNRDRRLYEWRIVEQVPLGLAAPEER
jgi:hypothetical protein